MLHPTRLRRVAGLLLALTASQGARAEQPPLRAAVLVRAEADLPRAVVRRSETDLVDLLAASGRYQLMETALVEARLGLPPDRLFERCMDDDACWQQQAAQLGLDQLVVVRLRPGLDRPVAHVLLVDLEAGRPLDPRRYRCPLPRDGGAPLDEAEQMFFGDGALVVRVQPLPATLTVDEDVVGPVQAAWRGDPIPAGKHVIRVEAEGHQPRLLTVMVRPGRTSEVEASLPPLVKAGAEASRWAAWATAGVAVTGLVVVFATQSAPADASPTHLAPP